MIAFPIDAKNVVFTVKECFSVLEALFSGWNNMELLIVLFTKGKKFPNNFSIFMDISQRETAAGILVLPRMRDSQRGETSPNTTG